MVLFRVEETDISDVLYDVQLMNFHCFYVSLVKYSYSNLEKQNNKSKQKMLNTYFFKVCDIISDD